MPPPTSSRALAKRSGSLGAGVRRRMISRRRTTTSSPLRRTEMRVRLCLKIRGAARYSPTCRTTEALGCRLGEAIPWSVC